ncbi:acyl-CoA synthetase [Rhodococcus pyridinivorans]|uniref:Acyl-CoA synthetase n=2 Tax=Rhodococcus TaxID=1827 RepID=A0A7M2XHZ8_9NOCA|nr:MULTISPECIES: acyl-CoA synthetase [Rhodococcus]AOD23853.1 acyl-CoA synthetase [Rhodococcus sp. p52]APE09897.1 acyl-CoA synthetase [Rhodococcus sp. 2G]MBX4170290.1 acyl-CoA synthetase [Rhodococcus sp. DMU2021]MCW3470039.1 acyl-CoA synthetase [Rhodococcus pyridinivorans]QOV97404.1 acyl-CoA synthetase [Rhodococcus pyridinivorans]
MLGQDILGRITSGRITLDDTIGQVKDTIGSLAVLHRAGLLHFPRVDHSIGTIMAANKYGPFAGAVHAQAERGLDAVALIDEAGDVTYKELEARSNALVRAWQRAGVEPGSVMGIMARNHRGLVLTMLATAKLGVRLVMMNTGFAPRQLVDVAAREQVSTFVFDSEFAEVAAALPDDVRRYVSWADDEVPGIPTLEQSIEGLDGSSLPAPEVFGGFVLLTSGTTGTPKGAPRGRTSPFASVQFLDRVPLRPGQTMLMAAPAFHGTGVSQFALALALGQTVVMMRRFSPVDTLGLVEQHGAIVLVVVPTMLQRILDLGPEKIAEYDTSSLKIVFSAGSSLSPDVCRRTTEAFGHVLYNLYGSTECAVATVATPDDIRQAPGTAGRPPVTCRVVLFDDDGNRITEPHVPGRIFVSSGLSFAGYTDGRDKERIDGLLSIGDIGHWDENGLLFVNGRDDDMIVSGGENVYPLEVENLLAEREDILDAAVVGVPDPEFGQRLRAFVVPSPDSSRNAEDIKAFVKSNLARYKVPREVVFLDELPRNATGKLLRRVLVEMDLPEDPEKGYTTARG